MIAKNSASLSSVLLLSPCVGRLAGFIFAGETEGTAEARLTGETDADALALGFGPALTEDLARGLAVAVGFGFALSWLVPSPRSESRSESRLLLPDCAGLPAGGPLVAARGLEAMLALVLAARDVDAVGALWRISKRGELGGARRLSCSTSLSSSDRSLRVVDEAAGELCGAPLLLDVLREPLGVFAAPLCPLLRAAAAIPVAVDALEVELRPSSWSLSSLSLSLSVISITAPADADATAFLLGRAMSCLMEDGWMDGWMESRKASKATLSIHPCAPLKFIARVAPRSHTHSSIASHRKDADSADAGNAAADDALLLVLCFGFGGQRGERDALLQRHRDPVQEAAAAKAKGHLLWDTANRDPACTSSSSSYSPLAPQLTADAPLLSLQFSSETTSAQ